MTARTRTLWTFAITSIALFMVTLDNLVVTTAIPVIRRDLHASISQLEWTVNAYTLTFAVLLLTGAALGPLRPAPAVRARTAALHRRLGRGRGAGEEQQSEHEQPAPAEAVRGRRRSGAARRR